MMRKLACCLALAFSLQACGNSQDRADLSVSLQAMRALPGDLVSRGGPPDPATVAKLRAALQADGKPAISVALPGLKYAALMVPYYPSKGALTWASASYETVTLRDGMLVATRGMGPDLMASQGPTAAQIATARGSFHRIYEYLDGGDQVQLFDYDCDFAPGGAAKVAVLGLSYDTRLVVETCSKGAERFENRYWFDKGGKIRQSEQMMAPGTAAMTIQRIVD